MFSKIVSLIGKGVAAVFLQLVEYAIFFVPPLFFIFLPIPGYLIAILSLCSIGVVWFLYYKLRKSRNPHYRG